jgi:hypothetical protein
MRGYYFYLGINEKETKEMIGLANKIVTKSYVREFIKYYEAQSGLLER